MDKAPCPKEVEQENAKVKRTPEVLVGIGYLVAHLFATEVVKSAFEAREDVEAGDISVVALTLMRV